MAMSHEVCFRSRSTKVTPCGGTASQASQGPPLSPRWMTGLPGSLHSPALEPYMDLSPWSRWGWQPVGPGLPAARWGPHGR